MEAYNVYINTFYDGKENVKFDKLPFIEQGKWEIIQAYYDDKHKKEMDYLIELSAEFMKMYVDEHKNPLEELGRGGLFIEIPDDELE